MLITSRQTGRRLFQKVCEACRSSRCGKVSPQSNPFDGGGLLPSFLPWTCTCHWTCSMPGLWIHYKVRIVRLCALLCTPAPLRVVCGGFWHRLRDRTWRSAADRTLAGLYRGGFADVYL